MGDNRPKLLDFMVKKEKECLGVGNEEKIRHGSSISSSCDENKLELRLGLPYDDNKQNKQGFIRSPISLSHFNNNGGKWSSSSSFEYKQLPVMEKNASQPCYTRIVDLQKTENTPSANTAVPNISQKRVVPTPVVGWPPIRSFRKNLASSSSAKSGGDSQNVNPSKPVNEKKPIENSNKGLFVKINMDGVPIGRKVDLSAYNCYENLSSAVDTLFRGLLAAQQDSSGGGIENKREEQKPITGLLDGTGEYTLVYEDNEGDRMLVGDVPWNMFVSTVKRLRVLKSSDLPTLSRGSKQGKVMVEGPSK